MSRLERAVVNALRSLDQGAPTLTVSNRELHDAVKACDPTIEATLSDVEDEVRYLNRDGRALELMYAEGPMMTVRLLPATRPRSAIGVQVNVNGGQVQVGDHNQMQYNSNTFGSVLVELERQVRSAELPPAEKGEALDALGKLLAHPLLNTILTLTLGGS